MFSFNCTFENHKMAVIAALAFIGISSAAYGYTSTINNSLPIQQEGNVRFITGGYGDEERTALNSVQNDYNLHVMSSGKNGEFSGDSQLTIYDKMGNEVLTTDAGPIFYATLPAGNYTISANNEGISQKKTVKVSEHAVANTHLVWN